MLAMIVKQLIRFPKNIGYRNVALPLIRRNCFPTIANIGSQPFSTIKPIDITFSVMKDLSSIIEAGVSWEDIEPSNQQAFQATAAALASDESGDYTEVRSMFVKELKKCLCMDSKDFQIIENYSGFGPELAVDCAIINEGTVLAFVVLDEPSMFENGELNCHHKIKQMLYNVKYRDSTCFFRLNVTELTSEEQRMEKIMKLVNILLDVMYGGTEDKDEVYYDKH